MRKCDHSQREANCNLNNKAGTCAESAMLSSPENTITFLHLRASLSDWHIFTHWLAHLAVHYHHTTLNDLTYGAENPSIPAVYTWYNLDGLKYVDIFQSIHGLRKEVQFIQAKKKPRWITVMTKNESTMTRIHSSSRHHTASRKSCITTLLCTDTQVMDWTFPAA